jgi:hypothetical protein
VLFSVFEVFNATVNPPSSEFGSSSLPAPKKQKGPAKSWAFLLFGGGYDKNISN